MANKVLLLRHGKSDWDADFDHDHNRPLAKRGVEAAQRMGRFAANAGLKPDRIVSSTAVRAVTTAQWFVDAAGFDTPIEASPVLYGAHVNDVLDVIRETPTEAGTVLLVGHQPTWSETLARLIGGGRIEFPTATLARVNFELVGDAWENAKWGGGRLKLLVRPKALKGLDGKG